jgi:uncharacterized protein YndB with AHSA1/START domain
MAHPFELNDEIDLDATPEQVWAAIATGPGVDSWFMGHSELADREGGRNSMSLLGFTNESTTTAWEPGKRFAYRSDEAPDGSFMAFEFLIEGRAGGSTVLRYVHSGMLGDNWEAEYDGLRKGTGLYLRTLATYLKHFPGRTAIHSTFLPGPKVPDSAVAWQSFMDAFGVTPGSDEARLSIEGLPPVDGAVAASSEPTYLSMRTGDGIFSLIHGYDGTVVAQHHDFGGSIPPAEVEAALRGWLESR